MLVKIKDKKTKKADWNCRRLKNFKRCYIFHFSFIWITN